MGEIGDYRLANATGDWKSCTSVKRKVTCTTCDERHGHTLGESKDSAMWRIRSCSGVGDIDIDGPDHARRRARDGKAPRPQLSH